MPRAPNFVPDASVLEKLRVKREEEEKAADAQAPAQESPPTGKRKVPVGVFVANVIDQQAEQLYNAFVLAYEANHCHASVAMYVADMFKDTLMRKERKRVKVPGGD